MLTEQLIVKKIIELIQHVDEIILVSAALCNIKNVANSN